MGEEGRRKYYYTDYGFMTKGWKTIDGKKYYFNKKVRLQLRQNMLVTSLTKTGSKENQEKEKAETTDNASEDVADSEDTASNEFR